MTLRAMLIGWLGAVGVLAAAAGEIAANRSESSRSIRLGFGETIVSTSRDVAAQSAQSAAPVVGVASSPYPQPRLVGFSPLVAITTSDERMSGDAQWEHVVTRGYVGAPLGGPPSSTFVVGILDSGSDVDLAAGTAADVLGMSSYVTGNTIPIGGAGGQIDADITQPLGFFMAGLDAINGGVLDTNQLAGHWNVAAVSSPAIECANGEAVGAIVGRPLISQFNHVIHVDDPIERSVDGDTYVSPRVEILDKADPLPSYSRLIAMEFGAAFPATTANYYGDFEDFTTPVTPTLLSFTPLSIPTGGAFFATVQVREGPGGPDNPLTELRMLVDTGAQSSIISPAVAAQLSLPLQGDFSIDICGIGGLTEDVPGYYVDYVKIAALGGVLEFSNAPFVMLDLQSPEGGPLDGILGMNFFWNRNVIFQGELSASSLLHVSDPLDVPFSDNDVDFDVDLSDEAYFVGCLTDVGVDAVLPECRHLDRDGDGDVDLLDFARMQTCFSGDGNPADADCGAW